MFARENAADAMCAAQPSEMENETMTKVLKSTEALSVATFKAGLSKVIAAMNSGEKTIQKARNTVSEAVYAFLETLPPISDKVWAGVCNAVVKEAFANTGWSPMTQNVRRSEFKVAAMAYTQTLLKPDAGQDWQAYAKAARAKLNGNGIKTNAKGQGRKARPASAKGVKFKSKDLSPMDHALALGLKNGDAKALIVCIAEHYEALSEFLAKQLSE